LVCVCVCVCVCARACARACVRLSLSLSLSHQEGTEDWLYIYTGWRGTGTRWLWHV